MTEQPISIPPLEGSTLANARTEYHEAKTNEEKEAVLTKYPPLAGPQHAQRYVQLAKNAAAKADATNAIIPK